MSVRIGINPITWSNDDMPALYSACDLFVFPSLHEGFGLTPLEAMACGAPVACSNTSSLPEVAGGAFQAVRDEAVLGRIDESARGQVVVADLRALGLADYGVFPDSYGDPPIVPEVFFDGQRMTLARWPNDMGLPSSKMRPMQ